MQAFDYFRAIMKERTRFQLLMYSLTDEPADPAYQVYCRDEPGGGGGGEDITLSEGTEINGLNREAPLYGGGFLLLGRFCYPPLCSCLYYLLGSCSVLHEHSGPSGARS